MTRKRTWKQAKKFHTFHIQCLTKMMLTFSLHHKFLTRTERSATGVLGTAGQGEKLYLPPKTYTAICICRISCPCCLRPVCSFESCHQTTKFLNFIGISSKLKRKKNDVRILWDLDNSEMLQIVGISVKATIFSRYFVNTYPQTTFE